MIKKANKKNNTEDVVANSCLGKRSVGPSGDRKNINIESLIHIVRGQKVMLDSDLAMLYGVTTSRLNEQVKRNINRFPDDFMFQLSKDEWSALRSQIVILEDMKSQNVISNISENQQEGVLMSQIAISKPKSAGSECSCRGAHHQRQDHLRQVAQGVYLRRSEDSQGPWL